MKALAWIGISGEVVGVAMIVRGIVWGGRASTAICGIGCALLAVSALVHGVLIWNN